MTLPREINDRVEANPSSKNKHQSLIMKYLLNLYTRHVPRTIHLWYNNYQHITWTGTLSYSVNIAILSAKGLSVFSRGQLPVCSIGLEYLYIWFQKIRFHTLLLKQDFRRYQMSWGDIGYNKATTFGFEVFHSKEISFLINNNNKCLPKKSVSKAFSNILRLSFFFSFDQLYKTFLQPYLFNE